VDDYNIHHFLRGSAADLFAGFELLTSCSFLRDFAADLFADFSLFTSILSSRILAANPSRSLWLNNLSSSFVGQSFFISHPGQITGFSFVGSLGNNLVLSIKINSID